VALSSDDGKKRCSEFEKKAASKNSTGNHWLLTNDVRNDNTVLNRKGEIEKQRGEEKIGSITGGGVRVEGKERGGVGVTNLPS